MKKVSMIALALVISLSLSLSAVSVAIAADVPTGVNVTGGTTTPPIIKAKWERDLTANLEDGDIGHAIPGSQFLPPGVYGGTKVVQYWVVVTDPEGVSTVETVTVDVFHPVGPPEYGVFKYQVILTHVPKFERGIPQFEKADAAGLVHYNVGYDYAEVWNELDKCTAEVYMGSEVLSYHQPCGDYKVVADACDTGNAWAHENGTDLENYFTYVCVPAFEVDFNALDYGNVSVCSEKWIAGDTVFDAPLAPAPDPNPATVRNIGNTDIKLTVHQDDMGFGYSGTTGTAYQGLRPPRVGESSWNVVFDARMGSDPANGMYYDPSVTVELPNTLPLCNTEELDFSIHIVKSTFGPHTGTITLGCVEVAFK